MARYFLEVSYDGRQHAGFQIQKNAPTIQGAVNHSLETILKYPVTTYGSSRTDSGVHARQNYLHIDLPFPFPEEKLYNINAVLPHSIVLKSVRPVVQEAHARFSAVARSYQYVIYTQKDPFLKNYGYFYPYPVDVARMKIGAERLLEFEDFASFSKRNTQVKTFLCNLQKISWKEDGHCILFSITANRFLRGMVRALVATLLKVGRDQMSYSDLEALLVRPRVGTADFSAPPQGLFLERVYFPPQIFL